MSTIAKRIKTLRKRQGLTQDEVALSAGVSRILAHNLETGKTTNPTIATLRALARCFGVTVAYLIGEAER